jgi:hypothetical protein
MIRWFCGIVLAASMLISIRPAAVADSQVACCVGDCDGDGQVTVVEILQVVNLELNGPSAGACSCLPECGPTSVQCDPIVQAVNNALNGCGT